MAYGIVQADVIGTSVAGSNLGAGNASTMKNRIINGAMVIDQRNAGASVATSSGGSAFVTDRWSMYWSQTSKMVGQQNPTVISVPIGFYNYLGITSSSAYSITSTDYFSLQQRIEGFNVADLFWGSVNAKAITLSFWVQSSLIGTFGGAITNSAGDRSYPFIYTIFSANTWTQISINISGDTTGSWLTTNGIGIAVKFGIGAGATYSGTAGVWASANYLSATGATSVVGTSGATFYITGVQLEVGSSATGFEYRQYQQELALCQRYYQYVNKVYYAPVASNSRLILQPPSVTPRTTPSISTTANNLLESGTGATLPSWTVDATGAAYSTSISYTAGVNYGYNAAWSAEL